MARTGAVLVAMSLLVVVTAAQQEPAFEVASVRLRSLNSSEDPAKFLIRITAGRVELVQPLEMVLLRAFQVKAHQLVFPDDRADPAEFVDIRAIIPPGVTTEQVPGMLRELLVQRFGLVTHTEARTMDVYHLLVGASGIKMREVEPLNELDEQFDSVLRRDGTPVSDLVRQIGEERTRIIQFLGGTGSVRTTRLTSRTRYDRTVHRDPHATTIDAVRMTMAELVPILTANLDEPVIDRTSLNGLYQFRIELPEDEIINRVRRSFGRTVDSAPQAASTFKAVETLGLKLERRRGPVDVIVVDSIRRTPTEN